jgi:hypothetical protein
MNIKFTFRFIGFKGGGIFPQIAVLKVASSPGTYTCVREEGDAAFRFQGVGK